MENKINRELELPNALLEITEMQTPAFVHSDENIQKRELLGINSPSEDDQFIIELEDEDNQFIFELPRENDQFIIELEGEDNQFIFELPREDDQFIIESPKEDNRRLKKYKQK